MKFLFGVLVGLVVLGVGAAAFAAAGLFNAAASIPPTAAETKIARFALDRVGRAARAEVVERTSAPIRRPSAPGSRTTARCASAATARPASMRPESGRGAESAAARPVAGPRPEAHRRRALLDRPERDPDDGMPAFGTTHKDEEIWKIVAFLRQLPALTPEQEKELKLRAAPEGSAGD